MRDRLFAIERGLRSSVISEQEAAFLDAITFIGESSQLEMSRKVFSRLIDLFRSCGSNQRRCSVMVPLICQLDFSRFMDPACLAECVKKLCLLWESNDTILRCSVIRVWRSMGCLLAKDYGVHYRLCKSLASNSAEECLEALHCSTALVEWQPGLVSFMLDDLLGLLDGRLLAPSAQSQIKRALSYAADEATAKRVYPLLDDPEALLRLCQRNPSILSEVLPLLDDQSHQQFRAAFVLDPFSLEPIK